MEPTEHSASLGFVLTDAPSPVEGGPVAVLLHGRGSDEADLQGLRGLLPDTWPLVTPRAPHPGGPWGYGPGWAWYRYVEQDRVAPETLSPSLAALDRFLDELPVILGRDPGHVVLGGFSQGGTTSLAYALAHPGRVGVVLNFSGFLPDVVDPRAAPDAPPVFWGHGLHDPAIPHALAIDGRTRLERAGIDVTVGDYAIGHWIVPEEVAAAVDLARSVVD